MLNESDLMFVVGSVVLLGLSYYFMVVNKKQKNRRSVMEEVDKVIEEK